MIIYKSKHKDEVNVRLTVRSEVSQIWHDRRYFTAYDIQDGIKNKSGGIVEIPVNRIRQELYKMVNSNILEKKGEFYLIK